jgi:hypothetical protein
MADDWRIHITVEEQEGLLDRLGDVLGAEARELAEELEKRRLAVSRDGDELFVYASSRSEAVRAGEIIDAVLREQGIEAKTSRIEHWLDAEDRWDDEPPGETWEEEELDRGYAPWEVRVALPSHREARELGLEGGRRGARRTRARRGRAGRRARLGDRAGEPFRSFRRIGQLGNAHRIVDDSAAPAMLQAAPLDQGNS